MYIYIYICSCTNNTRPVIVFALILISGSSTHSTYLLVFIYNIYFHCVSRHNNNGRRRRRHLSHNIQYIYSPHEPRALIRSFRSTSHDEYRNTACCLRYIAHLCVCAFLHTCAMTAHGRGMTTNNTSIALHYRTHRVQRRLRSRARALCIHRAACWTDATTTKTWRRRRDIYSRGAASAFTWLISVSRLQALTAAWCFVRRGGVMRSRRAGKRCLSIYV